MSRTLNTEAYDAIRRLFGLPDLPNVTGCVVNLRADDAPTVTLTHSPSAVDAAGVSRLTTKYRFVQVMPEDPRGEAGRRLTEALD